MTCYPLTFEPMLIDKVWGGDRLKAYGKPVEPGSRVGESWEIVDMPTTSASGAGGGARSSVIASGPLAGKTLHDAIEQWGGDLMGGASLFEGGAFPLLVKLLDAREHLSVQVHPSPAVAAKEPGADLKTECWYVLEANPGDKGEAPVLFKGFKPGVTREQYEACIRNNGQGIEELMNAIPAVPGEMHDLPSGTIHALGAGVLVAEVQTPSDTTYRVFDWNEMYGRPQREIHLDEALASTLFDEPPAPTTGPGELVANDFYRVSETRGHCEEVALPSGDACFAVMLVDGMGASIASRSGAFEEVALSKGRTALIPVAIAADCVVRAGPATRALVASVS